MGTSDGTAGGRSLFLYFRVAREHEPAAVAALRRLHAEWSGMLECELLRRADDGAGSVTLMEVYRRAGGVSADLQATIEREAAQRVAPWLVGPRHVEVFEPCA